VDWINLIIAGLLEVVWASSLKYTEGFTSVLSVCDLQAQNDRMIAALHCPLA